MTVILEAFPIFRQLLGAQAVEPDALYRAISFTVLQTLDGIPVAYNVLTGEMLELTADEAAALSRGEIRGCDAPPALIEKWFLVPTGHDDIGLSCEALELARLFQTDTTPVTYTIFTTTDCNARCFYCYEAGAPHVRMTAGTAADTAAFIRRNYKKGTVQFRWFGGEPLCNPDVIDIICTAMRDAGIPYVSFIVSNAYLFDDATVEKAKNLWNLLRAQVTLDGTEAIYNKTKAFVYKDGGSAFTVVTDNIERLLHADVEVYIRTNVGMHNLDDLLALADWIAARYPDKRHLRVYSHAIFEKAREAQLPNTAELRMQKAAAVLRFEAACAAHGMLHPPLMNRELRTCRCTLDSPRGLIILPDGRLSKCEHLYDRDFVGDIYHGVTETELTEKFRTRANSRELCTGCAAFPVCIQLKYCPSEPHYICDAAKRQIEESALRRRVEATWRAAKKKAAEAAE